jgi:inner membrane protein
VDPVTHAVLGAVTGGLVLGRQLGRRALGWGALVGVMPDADVIVETFCPTHWALLVHRGVTHSVFALALAAWLLAKPLARRWKKDKITPRRAATFVALVWGGHVLIDVFTTYGTGVLDPLPLHRASMGNLFVIDPLVTVPLLVGVVIGLFVPPKEWKKGRGIRAAAWCLGVSAFYVLLSLVAQFQVSRAAAADLARRGVTYQRRMESATPFNILLWRVLVDRPGEIWVGHRSVFDPAGQPIRWIVVPKQEEVAAKYSAETEVRIVKWFSQGWWIARESAEGIWLVDLRFGEMRRWDERGLALRPRFAWTFSPGLEGDRLRKLEDDEEGMIESRNKRLRREAAEMLRRMGRRIAGETNAWDGPARLIGPMLALQEPLREAE